MIQNNKILLNDHKIFQKVLVEAAELRWHKLNDYGQSYKNFGTLGVAVRMSDKMSRIQNILKTGKANNESLRDSFIDLVNYSAMGVMTIDQEVNDGV